MRYFIDFSYNGTNYAGWQKQKNAISVQEKLDDALSLAFNQPVETLGSSRTDAGVHAKFQVAHFDIEAEFDSKQLIFRLNSILPCDIAVLSIRKVKPDANARFDAIQRRYQYWITPVKNPFLKESAYYLYNKLDFEKLDLACQILKNCNNFESFSKVKTKVNHFECDIVSAGWRKEADLIIFEIAANRFLRGMVRAIVGTMLEVGRGLITLDEFTAIIQAKDRKKAGQNVPAYGLYLMDVVYNPSLFI